MKHNSIDSCLKRARTLHEQGNLTLAASMYREILAISPDRVDALFLLGTACLQLGDYAQARQLLERVLELQPRHCEALSNLGLNLNYAGQPEAALPLLEQALSLKPTYGDAWHNYGTALEACGRVEDAAAAYRRLRDLNPGRFDGPYNLGRMLMKLGKRDEAESQFVRALDIDPARRLQVLNDLGVLCHEAGRFEQAIGYLHSALALDPDFSEAHNTLAACLQEMGAAYIPQALEHYRCAARLAPADPLPPWNAAMLELYLGQLAAGWDSYELRWLQHPDTKHPSFPQWQGGHLAGQSILVYPEQGVGDELLFASCLPDLIGRATHVGILCDRRLAPLYARSFPDATVYGGREPGSENWSAQVADVHDCCVAIGSLPRYLRRSTDEFPDRAAYLVADPERVEYWRSYLRQLAGGRNLVGLCWRSGLRSGVRHRYYMAIEDCAPLFALPDIVWVNLQYDECQMELQVARERFGATVLECSGLDLRNDLDEQAAMIRALDAVVSAPTVVAELAGALGVPVLREGLGWTSLGTDHMPWHPTMQLFARPNAVAPWEPVMKDLAGALAQTLALALKSPPAEPIHIGADRCVEAALKVMEAEHHKEALRLCTSALVQDAAHADAWYLQGVLLARNGNVPAAIDSLTHALSGNPLEVSIYLARAGLYEETGEVRAALRDCQIALALDSASTEASAAVTRLGSSATVDTEVGAMVLAAWQRAAELHPEDTGVARGYAQALADFGGSNNVLNLNDMLPAAASSKHGTSGCDPVGGGLIYRLVTTGAGMLLTGSETVPEKGTMPAGFSQVQALLHPGSAVLVAGSGDGRAALACAQAVSTGGLVLVLEGHTGRAALLGASFVLNGLDQALVENVDAAGGEVEAQSTLVKRFRSQAMGTVLDRLGRCDLVWIEHAKPLAVLAELQSLVARSKPFLYLVGLQPDAALGDWQAENAYAAIVNQVCDDCGRSRADVLLHPSI